MHDDKYSLLSDIGNGISRQRPRYAVNGSKKYLQDATGNEVNFERKVFQSESLHRNDENLRHNGSRVERNYRERRNDRVYNGRRYDRRGNANRNRYRSSDQYS